MAAMCQNMVVMWQESGIRGHLFHLRNFLETFIKKFFFTFTPWNMEQKSYTSNYWLISTILDDFLVPKLFQALEHFSKYPIKTTFFAFLFLEQMYKNIYLGRT